MIEIRYDGQTWDAPGEWSEVSVRRYVDVALTSAALPPGQLTAAGLAKLTAVATGVPEATIRAMPAGKAVELAALVGFVWAEEPPARMAPMICLAGAPIADCECLAETGETLEIRDGEIVNLPGASAKTRATAGGFGCLRIENKAGAAHVIGAGPDGRLTIGGGTYAPPRDFQSITTAHFCDLETLGERLSAAPEGERGRKAMQLLPDVLAALYLRPGEDYLTSPPGPRRKAFEAAPVVEVLGALDFFLNLADVSANATRYSLSRRTEVMEAQNKLSLWSLYILAKRSGGGTLRAAWLGAFLKCARYWPVRRRSSSPSWQWKKPTTTTRTN